jgi:hypothetical protein
VRRAREPVVEGARATVPPCEHDRDQVIDVDDAPGRDVRRAGRRAGPPVQDDFDEIRHVDRAVAGDVGGARGVSSRTLYTSACRLRTT